MAFDNFHLGQRQFCFTDTFGILNRKFGTYVKNVKNVTFDQYGMCKF